MLMTLIPFLVIAIIYVWYLRLAAKWTLNRSVNRKLCWAFVGIVYGIAVINFAIGIQGSAPLFLVVGSVLHLIVGGFFFGKFAVDSEGNSPGFIGGLKMTGVALALLGVTSALLIFIPAMILKMMD